MPQYPYLDGLLIGVMFVGLVGYFWSRKKNGEKKGDKRGIGARGIQFVGVCLLIPGVVLLALECKLSECSVGTIIGAFAGYLLSGLGAFDQKSKGKPEGETPIAALEQRSLPQV